jgi:hypothetical protein
MADLNGITAVPQSSRDLQVTPWVRGRDRRRAGGRDVRHLATKQLVGLIGLS